MNAGETDRGRNPDIEDVVLKRGYNGNRNLKKVGEVIEWTEEQVAEYIRCSEDPVYFITNYMKIINVDRGLVPFELYDFQEEMISSMATNRFTVITTARQVGKSTTTCAFILWYVLFNPEKTVALLANKAEVAREILGRVKLAYQHLPKWLQQGVVEWNKGSIELENNSRIIASATSADAIRGFSINLLFIDEAAFIDNWEEFFTSTFPTVSSGSTTKVVLVSTPNGLNHFHKLWVNAKRRLNDYNPIEVHWSQVPGRDEEWKRATLAGMDGDLDKFSQEYECEFMGSSGTLVAGWKLKQLVHLEPIARRDIGLSVYENPIEGHTYVAVVDVSKGRGLDYSAFSVFDVTSMPYQQVAVFRSNVIAPYDYAEVVYQTCRTYNEAWCLVENNNSMGATVANCLAFDLEYENVVYTESAGRNGKRVSAGWRSSVEVGINTTKTVKAIGCSMAKLLIEQDQLIIQDYDTIAELSTFSKKGQSYEAEAGKNDDLVMGVVLFGWFTNQPYFRDLTDINTISRLRDMTKEQIDDHFVAFGFDDGLGRDPHETAAEVVPAAGNWLDVDDVW